MSENESQRNYEQTIDQLEKLVACPRCSIAKLESVLSNQEEMEIGAILEKLQKLVRELKDNEIHGE